MLCNCVAWHDCPIPCGAKNARLLGFCAPCVTVSHVPFHAWPLHGLLLLFGFFSDVLVIGLIQQAELND